MPLVVPPFLPDIGPIEDRKAVDEVQSSEILKPDVDIDDRITPGGPLGEHSVRIMRPKGVSGELPVILYAHGAGVLDPARS